MLQPDQQNYSYTMCDETTLLRKAMVSYSFDSHAKKNTVGPETALISLFLNALFKIQALTKLFSYKI